jgi:SAM-dependent methyltransferase
MSLYGRVYSAYRRLPEPARRALADLPWPVARLRHRIVSRLERGARPDEIYNPDYYDQVVDPIMLSSSDQIAQSIQREFQPGSVIDVGCGTGALMASLEGLGVTCLGFDRAAAALERCRRRGLEVRRLDVELDPFPPERADLVVSTEVAEHLPESAADRFAELLALLAPVAVVTAAPPGTGGKDHVNEQEEDYWVAKFAARDFVDKRDVARRLREEWRSAGVDETYVRSVMVFRAVSYRSDQSGSGARVGTANPG